MLTLADVTPIARLLGEYEVVIVPTASRFRSLPELIRAFRDDPESISWAGGSAGGPEQMLAWLIADAVGVDPKRVNYVAFAGGGEMMPAVLGGQVTVGINLLAGTVPQIEARTVRVLAISSAERLSTLDVPTLREQGVDVELENWRSLVAPPGVSVADRRRHEGAAEAMVRSPAWRDTLERYRWNDRFLSGPAFARFVDAEEERVRAIVRKLGTSATEASATTGSYPVLVLAALTSAMVAFVVGLRRREGLAIEHPGAGWRAVLLIAAGIIIDLIFIERLGFVLASGGLFWLTARAFDAKHPLRDAGVAAALSVATYLVFARLLDVSLPPGVLAGWL